MRLLRRISTSPRSSFQCTNKSLPKGCTWKHLRALQKRRRAWEHVLLTTTIKKGRTHGEPNPVTIRTGSNSLLFRHIMVLVISCGDRMRSPGTISIIGPTHEGLLYTAQEGCIDTTQQVVQYPHEEDVKQAASLYTTKCQDLFACCAYWNLDNIEIRLQVIL